MTEYFIIDEHTNFYVEAGVMTIAKQLEGFTELLPQEKQSEFRALITQFDKSLDIRSETMELLYEHDKRQKEMFYYEMSRLVETYGAKEMSAYLSNKITQIKERNMETAVYMQELDEGVKEHHSKNSLDDLFGEE